MHTPAHTAAPGTRSASFKKPFVPKGHDAQLQDAQFNHREVSIRLMSGDEIIGVITKRDKWTVTVLEHEAKHSIIIYKHAIETVVIKDVVVGAT